MSFLILYMFAFFKKIGLSGLKNHLDLIKESAFGYVFFVLVI